MQNSTSLDDLLGASFQAFSHDRVYKVSDMLLQNKADIEQHLADQERNLFNLEETLQS